jgi:anti-anti-sigma factor
MQITQRRLGDVVVLELKGTLHCDDGDRELEAIVNDLTSRGCIRLVINLKDVTHIDTMCLGVFIAALVRCQRGGGAVKLLQTPPRIQHMLTITRIDQFLPTYTTEAEAIRALAAGGVSDQHDSSRELVDS